MQQHFKYFFVSRWRLSFLYLSQGGSFHFKIGTDMVKFLQTRTVNYKDLCSKNLINDLKEAATCEVSTVCRLACNRCPYALERIDVNKVYVKGLSSYTIKLEKVQNEQLLISITAPDISSWLLKNNLLFITRKAMTLRDNKPSKGKHSFVNHCRELACKVS
jgi:hypothetical protein